MNSQIIIDMQNILHGYRKDGDVQDSIYDLADAILELVSQNAALNERVARLEKAGARLPSSVLEALNSGDGSYKP